MPAGVVELLQQMLAFLDVMGLKTIITVAVSAMIVVSVAFWLIDKIRG